VNLWLAAGYMILFLLLKGFFSGSEMALVNADKIRMRHAARRGNKGARLLLKMYQRPDLMLSTTLVGTNIATVAVTTLAAMLMIEMFAGRGDLYAFLIFTPILLILGEIVPKSVYQQKADAIGPVVAYPVRAAYFLFYPIIFIFSRIARLVNKMAGGSRKGSDVFMTREQLRAILEITEKSSDLAAFKKGRIRRAIRFGDTLAGEAMRPLAEATVFDADGSTDGLIKVIRSAGYHRIPVYRGSPSNIVGVASVSVWGLMQPEVLEAKALSDLIQPALYVTSLQALSDLVPVLRHRPDHMAVVVDEFGSAIGILTLEDIFEELIGDIEVGYHFSERPRRRRRLAEMIEDDLYVLDARAPISAVSDLLGIQLDFGEFHTVGGMLQTRLRRIPRVGESIVAAGYRFTVMEATERAVVRVKAEPETG